MAKKGFKQYKPADKLLDNNKPMEDQIELAGTQPEEQPKETEAPTEPAPVTDQPEAETPKRRRGRPKKKTEAESQVNVRVPNSILDRLNDVLPVVYGGNLTTYINRLIEKDLEENYDKYIDMLK